MSSKALELVQRNYDSFNQLKLAQQRLEQARSEYDLGMITRAEYITATEQCIEIIRVRSNSYKKP